MAKSEDKKWRQILARAKRFACLKGYKEDADDFAQEYAICHLSGRRTNLENIFTDYLRKTYGATRTKKGKYRHLAEAIAGELDHITEGTEAFKRFKKECSTIGENVETYLFRLTPVERSVFFLYHYWQLTLKEIGAVYGRSETWSLLQLRKAGKMFVKFRDERATRPPPQS